MCDSKVEMSATLRSIMENSSINTETQIREEKTMKKLFVLMTLLVLVVSLPLSVSADIIYEPQDDFYETQKRYQQGQCYSYGAVCT